MPVYISDRRYEFADSSITINLHWTEPLALSDFSEIFRDIDHIYRIASEEVTSRISGANSNRKQAKLIVREFHAGSLEILADPYVTGVISSSVASAIGFVFAYTLKRIKGRVSNDDENPLARLPSEVLSKQKAADAGATSVQRTTTYRKNLLRKISAFELKLTVKVEGKAYSPPE